MADDLGPVERRLWNAFPRGELVDLRTGDAEEDDADRGGGWGPGRQVRARVITALLHGAAPTVPDRTARLRLAGARVTGRLDLSGAQIDHPLEVDGCWFDEGIDLSQAKTRSIRLTGCRMPHVEARTVDVDGHLELAGSSLGWLGP